MGAEDTDFTGEIGRSRRRRVFVFRTARASCRFGNENKKSDKDSQVQIDWIRPKPCSALANEIESHSQAFLPLLRIERRGKSLVESESIRLFGLGCLTERFQQNLSRQARQGRKEKSFSISPSLAFFACPRPGRRASLRELSFFRVW